MINEIFGCFAIRMIIRLSNTVYSCRLYVRIVAPYNWRILIDLDLSESDWNFNNFSICLTNMVIGHFDMADLLPFF